MTTSVLPQLGRYEIDVHRSTVTFRTRHIFGLAGVRGTFAVRSGMLAVAEPLDNSRLNVEIDASSFHTSTPARDRQARSARFLDVVRYPVLTFVADRFVGDELSGALTVRDVTQPVSLTIDRIEANAESFVVRARTRIDRYAFGVTASRGMAGRYLNIEITAHCVRR